MAERSKAPDSRDSSSMTNMEYSGPRMWAWVRIPLLTVTFFLFTFLTLLHKVNAITSWRVISKAVVGKILTKIHVHRAGFEPAT